jgi:hypothetical protein
MVLLFGSTSWFGCDDPLEDDELCEPELCCVVPAPPGVMRIVLDGGAGGEVPPLEDDPPPLWHGCTAIVSVWVPFGTTMRFDPGGGFVSPVFTVSAWSQVGMTIVRSARWAGITTCRTPGVCSAVDTGSPDELLDELLLLPPHALSPTTSAHIAPIDPAPRNTLPKVMRISPFA